MNNERIDLTQFERMISGPWRIEWIHGADTENEEPSAVIQTEDYGTIAQTFYRDWDKPYEATTKAIAAVPDLIAELKKCYEELDSLPTRWQMSEIHNYTKWLETVESYFLADGSFNQDADFVRKCAVNEQYGYRIEVIDGVETVVHESE